MVVSFWLFLKLFAAIYLAMWAVMFLCAFLISPNATVSKLKVFARSLKNEWQMLARSTLRLKKSRRVHVVLARN